MRVPIHPDDLLDGTGFIRLAKTLKRDWLGTKPISLSEASELMAKSLGYSNLHDLQCQAVQADAPFAPLETVMIQCFSTLTSELLGSGTCKVFNIGELQEQIFQWPFLQLKTYRDHYGHADNRALGRKIKTKLITDYLATLPTTPELRRSATTTPFSTRELQAIVGQASTE
jgi:hypothetical protein